MKKIIKEWGKTHVITFTQEEMRIYKLNLGDVVQFNLIKIEKPDFTRENGGEKKEY